MSRNIIYFILEIIVLVVIFVCYQKNIYYFIENETLTVFLAINVISVLMFYVSMRNSNPLDPLFEKKKTMRLVQYLIAVAINILLLMLNMYFVANHNPHWNFG